MRVSVIEAEGQLSELVRRAEAGDEIVLTREGQAAVRLVPVQETAGRRSIRPCGFGGCDGWRIESDAWAERGTQPGFSL